MNYFAFWTALCNRRCDLLKTSANHQYFFVFYCLAVCTICSNVLEWKRHRQEAHADRLGSCKYFIGRCAQKSFISRAWLELLAVSLNCLSMLFKPHIFDQLPKGSSWEKMCTNFSLTDSLQLLTAYMAYILKGSFRWPPQWYHSIKPGEVSPWLQYQWHRKLQKGKCYPILSN